MLKNSKLYSIFANKCPKCHQGDFFVNKNPYSKGFIKMNDRCKHCNESFNKEVGFYYGAMYVSYGFSIAIGIALFILLVVTLKMELINYLMTFFAVVLLLFPWTMRTSRLIYINMFVDFDPNKK